MLVDNRLTFIVNYCKVLAMIKSSQQKMTLNKENTKILLRFATRSLKSCSEMLEFYKKTTQYWAEEVTKLENSLAGIKTDEELDNQENYDTAEYMDPFYGENN